VQDDFYRWYASMSFGDDAGHAEKRWQAIDALVEKSTRQTLGVLTRLAFRVKLQMSAPEIAEVRSKLGGELQPPGDEELVMLAASALAWAMDPEGSNSALAATMVATASCGRLRALEQPMDLLGMSERTSRKLAEASRRRPSLEFAKPLTTSLDKAEVAAAMKLASEGDQSGGLESVITSINKVLGALARRQATVEGEFRRYTKFQDEELDILWWLQGGHCAELQMDFPDVPAEHRPLAIARELASLTKVLPGPTAVLSLLSRAGVSGAMKLSIAAAVQGMPEAWLDTALAGIDDDQLSPVTSPILFALSRRKELDGAEGWASAWGKLTSLDPGSELEPLRFAEAAYREFVLLQLG